MSVYKVAFDFLHPLIFTGIFLNDMTLLGENTIGKNLVNTWIQWYNLKNEMRLHKDFSKFRVSYVTVCSERGKKLRFFQYGSSCKGFFDFLG